MAILSILPLVGHGLLMWSIHLRRRSADAEADWRASFLLASIAWGATLVLITEVLSFWSALTRLWVGMAWGGLVCGMLVHLWVQRLRYPFTLPSLQGGRRSSRLDFADWMVVGSIGLFLSLTFLTACLAPTNNNDSLSYHMSRVVHWIQNGSVYPYATVIDRQIWMPPWAEYAITNLAILWGGDALSNLVQWSALVGCLIGVSLIAKRLGASRQGQWASALFCVTIPMAILQASSTQNDLVTAFWVVVLADRVVDLTLRTSVRWTDGAVLGATVGLGVLTKGTTIVYALPLLIWLGLVWLLRRKPLDALRWVCWVLAGVAFFNLAFWMRNLDVYHSFLGPREGIEAQAGVFVQPKLLLSNFSKNMVFHVATPSNRINGYIKFAYQGFHDLLGVDLDATTYHPDKNRFTTVGAENQEDVAGNPVHFWILCGTMLILLVRARDGDPVQLQFITAWIAMLLLFSLIFPWQPWGSRLQTAWFLLGGVLFALVFDRAGWRAGKILLCCLLLLGGARALFFNQGRPLITYTVQEKSNPGLLTATREEIMFRNHSYLLPSYHAATRAITSIACDRVGLQIDSSDPEYLWWWLLNAPWSGVGLRHMHGTQVGLAAEPEPWKACAIVCTICGAEQETWGGYVRIGRYGEVNLYTLAEDPELEFP